ncbi:hypothetical protein [Candidatus Ichthyocystis hellenicum]|uniref:hypothetical protein n=1 Tax=Candidatus Ichthyocystis hellenicum TaxID=1561003 RepID=UPI000A995437|nr:hypothetical protein [Candidatus Ichthyocystis hellenicum]
MSKISKNYLIWLVGTKVQKWSENPLASIVMLLLSIGIIISSSLYFSKHEEKEILTTKPHNSKLDIRNHFFRDFIRTKDENELINKILLTYNHIDVKKLSNSNSYQAAPNRRYATTNASIYFETSAENAQKIAASILNISPLIILNTIYFSKSGNRFDENPQINVKMDLTLITNRSFKV